MCPEGPFLVRWGLEAHYQKIQGISLLVLSSDGNSEYSIYALWLSEIGVSGQLYYIIFVGFWIGSVSRSGT
jgi:hypothetical protein